MISLITINVQGLRTLSHRQALMSRLNCFEADLVCMQETHTTSESELEQWFKKSNLTMNNKLNYQTISSSGIMRSAG